MLKNLVLTGGLYHPFDDASKTLQAVLDDAGFASTVTDDMDHGFAELATGNYDLLTVYALRWTMPQDKFAAQRAEWAFSPSPAQRQALQQHLAAGKGVLALHTAAICFDDWPAWQDAVGASWTWGHSYHPPLGTVQVQPTVNSHAIVAGLPAFAFEDEAYTDMVIAPGVQPLMEVRAAGQTAFSPCLWTLTLASGRLVYDALGHDSASLAHSVHRQIIQRSARWACGQAI
jgi:type 1 glutamine amidotransferase